MFHHSVTVENREVLIFLDFFLDNGVFRLKDFLADIEVDIKTLLRFEGELHNDWLLSCLVSSFKEVVSRHR